MATRMKGVLDFIIKSYPKLFVVAVKVCSCHLPRCFFFCLIRLYPSPDQQMDNVVVTAKVALEWLKQPSEKAWRRQLVMVLRQRPMDLCVLLTKHADREKKPEEPPAATPEVAATATATAAASS